jgi:hypothetical protein
LIRPARRDATVAAATNLRRKHVRAQHPVAAHQSGRAARRGSRRRHHRRGDPVRERGLVQRFFVVGNRDRPLRRSRRAGAKAATLRSAALAQVSGGTVDRIETDSGDAAYEVHMTNAGGQPVTVKFDKDLKFVNVESGMGK